MSTPVSDLLNSSLKPALAIVLFAALLTGSGRGLRMEQFAAMVDFAPARLPNDPLLQPIPTKIGGPRDVANLENVDSLDSFYAALSATERDHTVTRILHYGDSPVTGDLITGDARIAIQKRFGNAGHGFILIGKPWAWYGHYGMEVSGSGWDMHPATRPDLKDGRYGLGGVAFLSKGAASSRIDLRKSPATRVELWYEQQPGGGRVSVASGDAQLGELDTSSPGATASFPLPVGAASVELRTTGNATLYGITLERAGGGVVYDSIGLNGAFTTVLARILNEANLSAQLRGRKPNLVVINYGSNESGFAAFLDKEYPKELRQAIARINRAVPEASILIMSPMDRGERVSSTEIRTLPTIPKIVAIQQQIARDTGCAFYNTFAAMGGEGSAGRWYHSEPRLIAGDLLHPSPQGAKIVGNALVESLVRGYRRWQYKRLSGRP